MRADALLAELGHDPRYRAAQAALSNMLPLAVDKLRSLLTSALVAAFQQLQRF